MTKVPPSDENDQSDTDDIHSPSEELDIPAPEDEEFDAQVGWRYTYSQIKRDPTALTGLAIIVVASAMAVFSYVDGVVFGWLAQYETFAGVGVRKYWIAETVWYSPLAEVSPRLLPPVGPEFFGMGENIYGEATWAHPLGTDKRGRDILARLVYGSRVSMQVALVATGIGMAGGTVIGAVSGYYGGWVDDALMRFVETLYAIPFLVLVLAFVAAFGYSESMRYAMIAVGIVSIPEFARLIRSEVLSVREAEYVEAARAAGVRDRDIIRRHIIPNSFAPVLVQGTLRVGSAILIVAGLSFLGYGVQPPTPDWGIMLSESRNYMIGNAWYSIWPGIAILITVVGFNIFGDGLRDALDPKIEN
jgi:peptide/nickel transport system permease protein